MSVWRDLQSRPAWWSQQRRCRSAGIGLDGRIPWLGKKRAVLIAVDLGNGACGDWQVDESNPQAGGASCAVGATFGSA